jgi:phosphomannomutase
MNKIDITCFKAYDIRGRVPDQLNDDVAYRVGRAFVEFLDAKKVVVGHDIRLTSADLTDALVKGLTDGGADVVHIGQCGTEEVYFATFELGIDGGICVTASHNPMDYNGMKLVREGSRPISSDTGLNDIRAMAEAGEFAEVSKRGTIEHKDMRPAYIEHLLSYIDVSQLKPLKVVVNAGNGGAGAVVDGLEPHLPLEFIKVHHEPDGSFPNGIPNPLLPENQTSTANAVREHGADLGVAWDGDFDRCFFFDEHGSFIDGYYVVGLLAEAFLTKFPGSKIVHDPRLTWNTIDVAEKFNGTAVQSKTGHAFIKERMRKEDAVYGGEMSAHHYFKDFAYCDNGNIPWLLVTELMSKRGAKLSSLVEQRKRAYPCSGEINRTVDGDPAELIKAIEQHYASQNPKIDKTDGLSMEFDDWRCSVRMSSTEPLLRVNVEARGDEALMREKTDELIDYIDRYGK